MAARTRTLYEEREGCGTRRSRFGLVQYFGCRTFALSRVRVFWPLRAVRRAFLKPRKQPCVPRHTGMIPASQHRRVEKRNIIAVGGNGERRASCSDKIIYSWRYSCWASCFSCIGEVPTTSDTNEQERALRGLRIAALDASKTGPAAGSGTGHPPPGVWPEVRVPAFAAGLWM